MNVKRYHWATVFTVLAALTLPNSGTQLNQDNSLQTFSSEDRDESDELSQKIENLEREGSNYLTKVMKQLQEDKINSEVEEVLDPNLLYTHRIHDDAYNGPFSVVTPVYNISGPTPLPEVEVEVAPEAPPLSLTKEELAALYEAAVAKASQLKLKANDPSKPSDEHQTWESNKVQVKPSQQGQMQGPLSGYYYYYFPIKSFITPGKEKSKTTAAAMQAGMKTKAPAVKPTTPPTHQHLHATVTMIDSQSKVMEPLFMAISSFIGMALMFLFSVLLVPRFPKVKSKNAQFEDEEEMRTLGQIILEAMSGRDCNERLACEVARIFRGLKSDNKTLRILEIILPPDLSEHVSRVRKAADKKAKCGYITCTAKKTVKATTEETPSTKPPIKTYKLRPWKEKETAHDLWMKHFEKNKPPQKHYYYPNRYELVEKKS